MSSITGNSDNIFVNNAHLKIVKPGKGIVFSDGRTMTTAPPSSDSASTAFFSNGVNAFVITETHSNTGFAGNVAPMDAISVSSNLFMSYTGNLTTHGRVTAALFAGDGGLLSNIQTGSVDVASGTAGALAVYTSSSEIGEFGAVTQDGSNLLVSSNLTVTGNTALPGELTFGNNPAGGFVSVTPVWHSDSRFIGALAQPSTTDGLSLGTDTNRIGYMYAGNSIQRSLLVDNDITPFPGHTPYSKEWYYIYTVGMTVNNSVITSDDRLKHNEEDIADALGTINKLKLQKYDKTSKLMDADYNGDLTGIEHSKEIGFIAQEVMQIPELAFLVGGGGTEEVLDEHTGVSDTVKIPYSLNYGGIHNLVVQAIQELSAQAVALGARVASLENTGN